MMRCLHLRRQSHGASAACLRVAWVALLLLSIAGCRSAGDGGRLRDPRSADAFVIAMQQGSGTAAARDQVQVAYGQLPLHFEANQGQTDPQVRFLARGPGYTVFLTPTEAVVAITQMRNGEFGLRNRKSSSEHPQAAIRNPHSAVLRMQLVGAKAASEVSGLNELPGKANYFRGRDSAQLRTNVPTYAKVRYHEVYPGIDLVFYGDQRQLEYDFIVAPGVDPQAIRLTLDGADGVAMNPEGDLVLVVGDQELRLHKPRIYQEVNGRRHEIPGGYVFHPQSLSAVPGTAQAGAFPIPQSPTVGFEVAAYDPTLPLVIDPVLSYATFLGGTNYDSASAIAVDAGGNAYVTGWTASADFPTSAGAFDGTFDGTTVYGDIFVTKLNPAGTALVYSTFLGGSSGQDSSSAIALDAAGNAYVTGYARSPDFPTTPGTVVPTHNGYWEAFVTKLNPTGTALVYSTFLGGSSATGYGISVDAAGNAYVAGGTASSDFPTTSEAFDRTYNGGTGDIFVTKFNPAASTILYSTFIGGSGEEYGAAIAVDAAGSAYVTGLTTSVDFPTTLGAHDSTYNGGDWDAFVVKLSFGGTALEYSTFLGGSDQDFGAAIAVDAAGSAYVTGDTFSPNFPTTPGAFDSTSNGNRDAFVAKLNPGGTALVYSTYLGGGSFDYGSSIVLDPAGHAVVTGWTNSSDFPTTADALKTVRTGFTDAFVAKLNSTGTALVYSTLLGGGGDDSGTAIAMDTAGNVYVAGSTGSSDFPATLGAADTSYNAGNSDAFVAKLNLTGIPNLLLTVNHAVFGAGEQLILSATVTPGPTPVTADVYVALQLTDGSLLFLQGDGSLSSTLQPIVSKWGIGPYSGHIFNYTLTGGEPRGNYAWLAAFTQPGTLNFIGPIVSAPFRITFPKLSFSPFPACSSGGDRLTVTEVRGTSPTIVPGAEYEVSGRYRLTSRDSAMIVAANYAPLGLPGSTPSPLYILGTSGPSLPYTTGFKVLNILSGFEKRIGIGFYPAGGGNQFFGSGYGCSEVNLQ